MDANHQYTTTARWTVARDGVMDAELVPHQIEFSAPPEFNGRAKVWTPEHFLVAAVAGCFMTTFVAIAAISKLDLDSLEVSALGILEKREMGVTLVPLQKAAVRSALQFTHMTIHPIVTLLREADRERALRLLEKAEHSCLIANSLRANVLLEPEILVKEAVAAM